METVIHKLVWIYRRVRAFPCNEAHISERSRQHEVVEQLVRSAEVKSQTIASHAKRTFGDVVNLAVGLILNVDCVGGKHLSLLAHAPLVGAHSHVDGIDARVGISDTGDVFHLCTNSKFFSKVT